MKKIAAIIPQKCDDPPITHSIPRPGRLDRLDKTLIGIGVGLALAGVISSLLDEEEKAPDDENPQEQETDDQEPFDC